MQTGNGMQFGVRYQTVMDRTLADMCDLSGNKRPVQHVEVRFHFVNNYVTRFEQHYEDWCDAHGIPADKCDAEGRRRICSRIWYDEYCAAPDGLAMQPVEIGVGKWLYDTLYALAEETYDDLSMSG